MTTTTSSHPITVEGIRLDQLGWNVRTKDGWDAGMPVRGSDEVVSGRHGQLWVPNKKFDAGKFIVQMWVRGTDSDGVPPVDGDAYAQYRRNVDSLKKVFGIRHKLLTVQHNLGTLGTREMFGEIRQSIDPDFPGRVLGQFDVLFNIPAAFWQDTVDVNYDSAAGTVVGSKNLANFDGATAPMLDLWLVVDGQITNPRITDDVTGHWIQYNGTIANGQQWVVNTTTRASRTGAGIEFTAGGAQAILQTTKLGAFAPALFGLSAKVGGVPTATLGGTVLNGSTRLRVRGRRKYQ